MFFTCGTVSWPTVVLIPGRMVEDTMGPDVVGKDVEPAGTVAAPPTRRPGVARRMKID